MEQGIWRIRTNQGLRDLYKDVDVVADIKNRRLEWTGHVVRMDHGRAVKKMVESKPEGRRRMGRPRLRWLQAVEKISMGDGGYKIVTEGSGQRRIGICN